MQKGGFSFFNSKSTCSSDIEDKKKFIEEFSPLFVEITDNNLVLSDKNLIDGYVSMSHKPKSAGCLDLEKVFTDEEFLGNLRERIKQQRGLYGGNKSARKYTDNLCKNKAKKVCANVKGCKVASGSKRTYCRKTKKNTRCTKKSVNKPNTCKKSSMCIVASGSKRTYCRKAHNKTHKKK
jgi:hypothetical protein|uniref:Uncharacterized protein n=1 Tax=viral metagenome TaxID=1070528 RepID=A0A6C0IR89_9ZZZZ